MYQFDADRCIKEIFDGLCSIEQDCIYFPNNSQDHIDWDWELVRLQPLLDCIHMPTIARTVMFPSEILSIT